MTEMDKLQVLLPHWIEHNAEHAVEFREWAKGAGPAQEEILRAAAALEEANRALRRALEIVERAASAV